METPALFLPGTRVSPRGPRRAAGFSLPEVVVAVTLSLIALGVLGNVLLTSTRSVDYLVQDGASTRDFLRAFARFAEVFRESSTATITLDETGTDADSVTLQVAGPYLGAVSWGAPDTGGTWQAGWLLRYRVTGGDLVEESLDASGTPQGASRLLVRRADSLWNGAKGFDVTQAGQLITMTLRVRKTFSDGNDYRRQLTTSFYVGSDL